MHDLVELNTLIILFKARTHALPIRLMSFFNMNSNNIHSTRQEGNFKEIHCRTKIKSMCISVNGPKVWNNLDSSFKKCKNLKHFKKLCKSYMLDKYQYA